MASIEIIGDDNHVLINDTFKNMILIGKGMATFLASPPAQIVGSSAEFSYVSDSPHPPLLAINSAFPVVAQTMAKVGNSYTWQLVCGAEGRGRQVECFVLHLPEVAPNANGMIQLFNAQSVLVFDSNLQYAKVEQVFNYTISGDLGVNLQPNRKYACVTSLAAGGFQAAPYPPLTRPPLYGVSEQSYRSGFYMDSIGVRTRRFGYSVRNYATQAPTTGSYENPNGVLLILDVTGM